MRNTMKEEIKYEIINVLEIATLKHLVIKQLLKILL